VTVTASLAELRAGDEPRFGGKSAALGELLGAGIAVPPGFAVSTDAFRAFVADAGLGPWIATTLADLDVGDVAAVRVAARAIGEELRAVAVSEALAAEIEQRYGALAMAVGDFEPAVAVRSSACGEDGQDATFAGQQDTYLWVRGPAAVCDAVRRCWASLYSAEAIAYRARLGEAGPEPAMGVAVQHMVDAAVAGVLFTCNPVSGDPSVVAIDASWGLGLGVVGGDVTPDQYLVSKVTREIVRRTINRKAIEYLPSPTGSGTITVDVEESRAQAPCLDDDALGALVDAARAVEQHFGGRQDVEWAIDGRGHLFVLQARPVTASATTDGPKGTSAMSLIMNTFGVRGEPGDG
jgi:phosphoenolpyruvate synthase/pyruvate phosphate dikinase